MDRDYHAGAMTTSSAMLLGFVMLLLSPLVQAQDVFLAPEKAFRSAFRMQTNS